MSNYDKKFKINYSLKSGKNIKKKKFTIKYFFFLKNKKN